jgi:hypothetical protein
MSFEGGGVKTKAQKKAKTWTRLVKKANKANEQKAAVPSPDLAELHAAMEAAYKEQMAQDRAFVQSIRQATPEDDGVAYPQRWVRIIPDHETKTVRMEAMDITDPDMFKKKASELMLGGWMIQKRFPTEDPGPSGA